MDQATWNHICNLDTAIQGRNDHRFWSRGLLTGPLNLNSGEIPVGEAIRTGRSSATAAWSCLDMSAVLELTQARLPATA